MNQIQGICLKGPRPQIEDTCLAVELSLPMISRSWKWFIVCDGVGGHQGGDVCSRQSVKIISESVAKSFFAEHTPQDFSEVLSRACHEANRKIRRLQDIQPEHKNMATTVVVALVVVDALYVAWAGDSRCYLNTYREMTQLSRDHSLIQRWIDAGELEPEAAAFHPAMHTIYQYIGNEDFQPEVCQSPLGFGDIVILTSDGATDVLDENDFDTYIRQYRQGKYSFAQLPHLLGNLALERGTTDNVTILCYEHLTLSAAKADFPYQTCTGFYAGELARDLILNRKEPL